MQHIGMWFLPGVKGELKFPISAIEDAPNGLDSPRLGTTAFS